MVIHYDISDSLENYIQEAGRAGRNERIEAECYVLFNEDDLNKHFVLLNKTLVQRDSAGLEGDQGARPIPFHGVEFGIGDCTQSGVG